MDDEAIELMASHGTYLVADIYFGDWIEQEGRRAGWSEERARARTWRRPTAQREGFAKAVKAGVKIAYGTDSGGYPHRLGRRSSSPIRCGYGQTPMEAIRSATVTAADLLGWSDRVGAIAPGRFADLVAVPGDPTR